MDIIWTPRLARGVNLWVDIRLHFDCRFKDGTGGYCGSNQMIGVDVNLQELLAGLKEKKR